MLEVLNKETIWVRTGVRAGGRDFTDAVRDVTNPDHGLQALELGIGTNQCVLPEVRWQVNSQLNEEPAQSTGLRRRRHRSPHGLHRRPGRPPVHHLIPDPSPENAEAGHGPAKH